MTQTTVLRGGRVLTDAATGKLSHADVVMTSASSHASAHVNSVVAHAPPPPGAAVVEVGNHLVLPGLVDVGAFLRPLPEPDAEDGAGLALAARSAGVARLLVSPARAAGPGRVADAASAQAFYDLARTGAHLDVRVAAHLFRGPRELAELHLFRRDRVAAVLVDGVPDDTELLWRGLQLAAARGLPVIVRCIDDALARRAVAWESPTAVRLGLPTMPLAAETSALARLLELVRATRARVHVTHVATHRSLGLLAAAQDDGLPVTADTTALHVLVDDEAMRRRPYDPALRVWPPLPSAAAREAFIEAVKRGRLQLTSGHDAVPPREKALEFGESTAGAAVYPVLVPALLAVFTPGEIVAAFRHDAVLGHAPATVHAGGPADLVVIDDRTDRAPLRAGPFAGLRLCGQVTAVATAGALFAPFAADPDATDASDAGAPQPHEVTR